MRLAIVALVVLAVLGGGMAALSGLAREKPLHPVEKVVPLANLS